jgi:membrane-associated phospholipid phosphatase
MTHAGIAATHGKQALNENSQQMPWYRRAAAVIASHVLLKSIGTPLFIALFFGAYFYLLKQPAYPTTVMPITMLDRLVGFEPRALSLYVSLWVYVSLPPALLATRRELYGYALAMAGTCLAALIVFYLWPTAVPAADIDWAQYPDVAFLKSMDASGNACPSLHAATAVFSGIWLHYLLRRFGAPLWLLGVNWAWCGGIVYSAVATRQHVAVDVLAGLMLGILAAGLSLRYRARMAIGAAQSPPVHDPFI